MEEAKTQKLNRIAKRLEQVRTDAIRSRKFSQEEFTRLGVQFILSGIKISKDRDNIIANTRPRR